VDSDALSGYRESGFFRTASDDLDRSGEGYLDPLDRFFHFFNAYANDRFPWFIRGGYFSKFLSVCSPHSGFAMLQCRLESAYVLAIDFGYHAVGVFLLLSGLGLTYSLVHFVDPPSG